MTENAAVIRKILCQLYGIKENSSWRKILDAECECITNPPSELKKLFSIRFTPPLRELAMHFSRTNPWNVSEEVLGGLYDELANQIIRGHKRGLFENENVDPMLLSVLESNELIEIDFGPYCNNISRVG